MENKNLTGICGESDHLSSTDEQIVSEILKKLKSFFPAWRQVVENQEEIHEMQEAWSTAFMHARLTDLTVISRGLQRAEQSESPFFPSVGQFIRWCMPVPPMRVRVWAPSPAMLPTLREKYLDEFGCYEEDGIIYFG